MMLQHRHELIHRGIHALRIVTAQRLSRDLELRKVRVVRRFPALEFSEVPMFQNQLRELIEPVAGLPLR